MITTICLFSVANDDLLEDVDEPETKDEPQRPLVEEAAEGEEDDFNDQLLDHETEEEINK